MLARRQNSCGQCPLYSMLHRSCCVLRTITTIAEAGLMTGRGRWGGGGGGGWGTFGHSTVTTEPSAPMKVTMALPSAFTSFLTFTTSLQKVSLAKAELMTVLPRLAATGGVAGCS